MVRTVVHPMEPRVVGMLKEFAEHCAKVGARCVFSCPPQPPDLLETNISAVRELLAELRAVKHLRVIGAPEEQVYPLEQFYDTQYHLTREGAVRRSRLLVERLENVM